MEANQDTITKAIEVISDALEEHEIPQLEGAIAMQAILRTLADNGLDVRVERRTQA